LDKNHPQEERKNLEELDISEKSLGGELYLSDFVNLKKLNCFENQLTRLTLPDNSRLEILKC